MAMTIKTIPVMKNKSAKAFVKRADIAITQKETIDFSKQFKASTAILDKAKTANLPRWVS